MKNQKEIYEALLRGETITTRGGRETKLNENGNLTDYSNFINPSNWQIKKQPLEFWANIYPGGHIYRHADEKTCRERANNSGGEAKTIKLREVLDEE